jgi:FAD/FMN-containing dehydrogenase
MSLDALRADLERHISGEVRFDSVSRALYSTDASVYQIEPLCVVVPRGREDVVQTVQIATRHGVSITARGGGTSQAGQAIGAGVLIDTSKYLNRVLEVNVTERWARIEPGVVLDELNTQLKPHGLRFAPDISTASRATVGGMIANNSSGARSVLYGKTIDHVLELDVVLADGSIAHFRPLIGSELDAACTGATLEAACYRTVRELASARRDEIDRRFPKVLRRVGGYNLDEFVDPARPFNLSRIIVGSEGTLGLVVSAKVSLVPLPAAKAVLTIEFDELLDALGATPLVLRHGPSAVEVMDRFILDHAKESALLDNLRRSILLGDPGALLCVEFYGDRTEDLLPRIGALERDLEGSAHRCRWKRAIAPADQARIWSFREASLGLSMAMKGDGKSLSFVEDTAVAPEKLRDYIERFLHIVRDHDTVAGVYAHASVGCLHVRPVVNLKTADGVKKFESIANAIADLVLEFGGALSGEHGDGLVRGAFTEKMFGPVLYEAFRTVKRAFDPAGLFNPGKIVDTPPLTSNLRYGAGYQTPNPATFFDYTEHGGLGRGVEMCSGLGVCRKTLEGTMCPSYMATREEKHSTRGRANTLRLAMAGTLGGAGLSDHDVHDVLDLCLECRACKAECPVGVDVGRFKSEFLAGYWKTQRDALKTRDRERPHAVGVAAASRRSPTHCWKRRGSSERLLGIDRRRRHRRLKRYLARRFTRRSISHPSLAISHQPSAFRLSSCSTTPSPISTTLKSASLPPTCSSRRRGPPAPHGCCGRPDPTRAAERHGRRQANVDACSTPPSGQRIVFLEPSCCRPREAPDLCEGGAGRRESSATRVLSKRCRADGRLTFLST